MTRDERIYAIAKRLAQVIWPGQPKSVRYSCKSVGAATLRWLAEAAIDAADATREPCECRQCHLDRLANGGGL